MTPTNGYVLVLDPYHCDAHGMGSLLAQLSCSVFVTESPEQAVAQAQQLPPYLVILAGDNQSWSQPLVHQLRQTTQTTNVTIVALTDSAQPHWDHEEDNPGLDGFLVKPVSGDVLSSLIQSAQAKQSWAGERL